MKAVCTWGDGPDILLSDGTHSFDLNVIQAEKLVSELLIAIDMVKSLEQQCKDHDKDMVQCSNFKDCAWSDCCDCSKPHESRKGCSTTILCDGTLVKCLKI